MLRLFLSHSLDDIQCTFLVLEQQRLLKSNFTSNDSMDKLGLLLKINARLSVMEAAFNRISRQAC